MFGFVVGALCLLGLFKVVGGRHHSGWRHGHHHGRWHGHHGPDSWRDSRRSRWAARWLFERLDTSPGQEKVILEAMDEIRTAGGKAASELRNVGPDLARAVRAETLDHEVLKARFLRQDANLEELQRAILVAFEKVHGALDARQREELAQLLERGAKLGGPGRCGGWQRRDEDMAFL